MSELLRLFLPATSANLGPGFDALGLALDFGLTVEANLASADGITATGRDADHISDPATSLILTTCRVLLHREGREPVALHLRIDNQIPLGMGCGSSAAALVAGVALASHFGKLGWSPQRMLAEASALEGHPDNVAACVLGGLAVSRMDEQGRVSAVAVPLPVAMPLLLVMPQITLSTMQSRALLPDSYSRAHAVSNVQNVALLTAALATGQLHLLAEAMKDWLHQPYRAAHFPSLPVLAAMAGHAGVLGVALSGAGPSVLMLLAPDADRHQVSAEVLQRLNAAGLAAELIACKVGSHSELGVKNAVRTRQN